MFVIKYDKLSMIKLVKSIEKYPAIYNNRRHFGKEELDVSWDKVALEVGEKDSLCREKWHSIRSCYIRHLKYSALNSKRRPYYLAEYLDFLTPFVIDRIRKFMKHQSSNVKHLPAYLKEVLPSPESTSSLLSESVIDESNKIIKAEIIKTEVVDIEEMSESDWYSVGSDQPSSSKMSFNTSEFYDDVSIGLHNNMSDDVEDTEEELFFKKLLPDISRMSNHQKLKFKQEALSIIEDILYASEDVNITE